MTAGALASNQAAYSRDVQQTRQQLDIVDDTTLVSLTRLDIENIRALKQDVAEIFPASNLPAFLLQGLIQLEDRTLKPDRVAADLRVLFRGTKQIGLYGAFLAAPAMVLYGYQKLLALAGKDLESAFPDGPWQFYTQFGLREDAARHCVETVGFGKAVPAADPVDAATAWVAAALLTLFGYDDLLANEWEERALPRTLRELLAERSMRQRGAPLPRKAAEREQAIEERVADLRAKYQLERLESDWAARRLYAPPQGSPPEQFPAMRRRQYRAYLDQALRHLPADLRATLDERMAERRERDLPAYQRQMSLLIRLDAGSYQDRRTFLQLHQTKIALVVGGRYYLIDACARDARGALLMFPSDGGSEGRPLDLIDDDNGLRDQHGRPVQIDRRGRVRLGDNPFFRLRAPSVETLKSQVAAILRGAQQASPPDAAAGLPLDMLLAGAPRERQDDLRTVIDERGRTALDRLRHAPILLNWDVHDGAQPLPGIRQTHRGLGDHGMTLLRTRDGMVFDMSHICFDALWGMAVSEIMTNLATGLLPVAKAAAAGRATAAPLVLSTPPALRGPREPLSVPEADAETRAIDLAPMQELRKRLARRELAVTINDMLLLSRCIHAATYQPGPAAVSVLGDLAGLEGGPAIAQLFSQHIDEQRAINPALLIPMDASATDPRQRIFPATFRSPYPDLLHHLERCESLRGRRVAREELFEAQKALFRALWGFAALLRSLRQVTMRGESFTMAALRLMGHLPGTMQALVDQIPQKVSILNEIIKGREVFSNVGRVARESSITRFASARDDGETKLLVWGIVTDVHGRLVITLRDFRPHVAPLVRAGRPELAQLLAQDYLDAYANVANSLSGRLQRALARSGEK